MKKNNIPKVIWILSVFLVLIVILIAVMDYKIHYEYKIKNKLYFYECDGNLCVTEVEDDKKLLYSKYECGYEECPVFKSEINDKYVILEEKGYNILFDYRESKIISTDYNNYQFINNNYIIVTQNKHQGIIDINNKITVPAIYDKLGYIKEEYLTGYNLNNIIAQKDNLYGIISIKNGTVVEKIKYKEEEINTLLNIISNEENTSY